jgi:cytoskeletal protein RodZ
VTLREIADTTKLSIRALEALERNDISRLPGGIFSRGLVRAYAEQIGADPEAVVKDFIRRFPDVSVTDGSPYVRTEEVNTDPPSQFARHLVIAGAIAVPLVVIYGLWVLVRQVGW